MVLASPVFARAARLVAWVANIAHWNDVGGNVPGSMSTRTLPRSSRKACASRRSSFSRKGVPNRAVFDILYVNTRLPDYPASGDLWAGIAGLRIGERRVLELLEKYGVDTYRGRRQTTTWIWASAACSGRASSKIPEPAPTTIPRKSRMTGVVHNITPDHHRGKIHRRPDAAIPSSRARQEFVAARARKSPCSWPSSHFTDPEGARQWRLLPPARR